MPRTLKRYLKRVNKKRILYLVLFLWTIFVPLFLITYWVGYDSGRKAIQVVGIPVKSKRDVVNAEKEKPKLTLNLRGE